MKMIFVYKIQKDLYININRLSYVLSIFGPIEEPRSIDFQEVSCNDTCSTGS